MYTVGFYSATLLVPTIGIWFLCVLSVVSLGADDRIYWVNGADNVVSSSTLTGEDRQVRQLVVTASQFYALAFKDGELFVVARETLP